MNNHHPTIPIIIIYAISIPRLLTTIQICNNVRPPPPNASPTSAEYDDTFEARVNLKIKSIDDSVNIPTKTMMIRPGIMPSCLRVAGKAMIPAPTIVVERLKTAP